MISKITFSNPATIDLERIVSYYFEINKKTANRYYREILDAVKHLKSFPKY